MDWFYSITIVDAPIVAGMAVLAAAVFIVLVAARSTRWRVLRLLIAASGGAILGLTVMVVWNAVDAYDLVLPADVGRLLMAAGAAIGVAVACFWDPAVWRKVLAGIGVVVFSLAAGISINAYFGIDRTVGALFGVTTGPSIDVGSVAKGQDAEAKKPLYEWTPPADMPAVGRRGTVDIPSSGFAARKAGLYLPPAALTREPPRLPLVVFMMGYPGTPDPAAVSDLLDSFAAAHRGLAPIVVVADQVGVRGDPACADSALFGPAETYILKDVVPWAKRSLNVIDERAATTIGGYSNGGACAAKFAAERPDLFGSLFSISGEEFPGAENPQAALRDVFRGDSAAFEAAKPASILARHPGAYAHMTAVFTAGTDDPGFAPGVQRAAQAAEKAGMKVYYRRIAGAGHVRGAVEGGLREAFDILYPVLGLSAPAG